MSYLLILLGLGVHGGGVSGPDPRTDRGGAKILNRKTAVVTMIVGVGVVVFGVGVGGVLTSQPPSGTAANSATSAARNAPSATSTIATTAPTATANLSSKTPQASGGNSSVAAPGLADSVWDALAQCESGANWAINTGNGLFGGLQLDRGAWLSNGGAAYAPLPSDATREQQILIAEKVRADRGFSPWSSCARKLGLR